MVRVQQIACEKVRNRSRDTEGLLCDVYIIGVQEELDVQIGWD